MKIKMIENGEEKEIYVADMPKKQNAVIFLNMLNHFDPFVHTLPFWKNSIVLRSDLQLMANANASAFYASDVW